MSAVAEARARQALADAGFDGEGELRPLRTVTNEVWLTDGQMIRLNRRPDDRLQKEVEVARRLPAEVGYPEVLAYGGETGDDFLVTVRPEGRVLAHVWPSLSAQMQASAIGGLAQLMRAVHAIAMAPDIPAISDPPLLHSVTQVSPTEKVVAALQLVKRHANVDEGVVGDLLNMVRDLTLALEPFDSPTMIHGDLHFGNVIWDGHRVTGLLDYKWARAAPADLDLDVFLRYCSLPFIYTDRSHRSQATAEAHARAPWLLADAYPELFSSPRQFDRMRVYSIAHDIRELLLYPPPLPVDRLATHHPYRRLISIIEGRSHLDHLARAPGN